ncbi:hypothetical protein D9758_017599 [Tetrapyrgos nigripes]|uniref:Uncharacterized protein n=1 Tax=Tetrapyrgos nigripes TaxID=182062 RepID=A0A8H5C4R2_9AGAR|nr:hypothetical protein D9758_017599 [Tetrapyrgos nigripes]
MRGRSRGVSYTEGAGKTTDEENLRRRRRSVLFGLGAEVYNDGYQRVKNLMDPNNANVLITRVKPTQFLLASPHPVSLDKLTAGQIDITGAPIYLPAPLRSISGREL